MNARSQSPMWFALTNTDDILTPALLCYPKRVRQNIMKMKASVPSPAHLCPHVKTHKSQNITELFKDEGISQFKCATVAELLMACNAQATFGLLAYQPVGPNVDRLAAIAKNCPETEVATVFDNEARLESIARAAERFSTTITLMLDIDNGMGRTGIHYESTAECVRLYRRISDFDFLHPGGLHVYDGHIHHADLTQRAHEVEAAMSGVLGLRDQLLQSGMSVPRLVTGGTPSFPVHAEHEDRICSPGTPALWDHGYAQSFPDLDFLPAAVLATRVVSKLPENRICVDLGYKAIASEMSPPRAHFLNGNVVRECGHSEEHLVLEVDNRDDLNIGDILYAIPRHICPTVARHDRMLVVDDGRITDTWKITARDREISIE